MLLTYSNDFHLFAEQIFEDIKKCTNLPLELRSLDRLVGVDKQHILTETRELVDIKLENARFFPCMDLYYPYNEYKEGKSPEDVLNKALADIDREIKQYCNAEIFLHPENPMLPALDGVTRECDLQPLYVKEENEPSSDIALEDAYEEPLDDVYEMG